VWERRGVYPPAPSEDGDLSAQRLRWFCDALTDLAAQLRRDDDDDDAVTTVAFPWRIGCGLAGGDWHAYRAAIDAWATAHPRLRVRIVRLEPRGGAK
jgi:hypothetical protein